MAKGGANGYAALSKQRAAGGTKRRKLDDYETPEDKTEKLLAILTGKTPTLEPAAGSGRIARVLRAAGRHVTTADIKNGQNFLKRTKTFPGDLVTNPPYRDGLADLFVKHALKIADGRVAMLMEAKFLFGSKRELNLYRDCPPSHIIVIPERVYFYEGSGKAAKQISSQFFNHVWLVWPNRRARAAGKYQTVTVWAPPSEFEGE